MESTKLTFFAKNTSDASLVYWIVWGNDQRSILGQRVAPWYAPRGARVGIIGMVSNPHICIQ